GRFDQSSTLNNLAIGLHTDRFKQRDIPSDLNEAIDWAALALRPPGRSDRSMSLDNRDIAMSLRVRSEQRDILSDLDEAIELNKATLEL
ncbi:uncharacterized protein HD556DRAFT_1218481, partial [Suillus plorans]